MAEKKEEAGSREDLAGLDVRCCDELIWTENCKVEATYECWFDVDRYFGTDTRDDPEKWVNFYTLWDPKTGHVTPVVHVDSPDGITEVPFSFTPAEEAFFFGLMQEYCIRTEGMTLLELDKLRREPELCREPD